MAVGSCKTTDRFPRIQRRSKAAAIILCLSQINHPAEARAQTILPSYHVTLAWNANPDPLVVAYEVRYGTASRAYTASLTLGNVTTVTIPGLAIGLSYFFVLTAINTYGQESEFSSEVSFVPGNHAASLFSTADGEILLSVRGLIDHSYDIEASQDLITWDIISTVTMPDGGSLRFSDPDAAIYPARFYRTRESP